MHKILQGNLIETSCALTVPSPNLSRSGHIKRNWYFADGIDDIMLFLQKLDSSPTAESGFDAMRTRSALL